MKKGFKLLLISLFLSVSLFAQNKTDELFSGTNLLKHVKALSSDAFEGRRTGTKGGIKARKYIVNQFYSLGLKPYGKSYEQMFSFFKGQNNYEAANVIGFIKGSEFAKKYIIISAHYDHEGIIGGKIFNGADDNASGVAGLFAFAEYFKKYPPKHSVLLIAFDAEELGLRGSKYFVNQLKISNRNIITNLNMDMISRSEKNELFVVGTAYNKNLKSIISRVSDCDGVKLICGHDGHDGLENWTYDSDHLNFHKRDIPFLYFGVENHKDYHEPTDDFENINPEFYIKAVDKIIEVFKKIDQNRTQK